MIEDAAGPIADWRSVGQANGRPSEITLHQSHDGDSGVLPAEVLERLGIKPGESVYAIDRPGGVLLTSDPNFDAAMQAFDRARAQHADTFRRLAE